MRFLTILAVIGLILVLTTAIAMAAAGTQYWNLDSETTAAGYQMERTTGAGDNGQSGSVLISKGGNAIWLADEAAAADVTFSGGNWTGILETNKNWAGKMTMYIGEWNGASFVPFSQAQVWSYGWTWYGVSGVIKVEGQLDSETVDKGNYLALQICNTSTTENYTIYTNGNSQLSSPEADPGYPLPEIAGGVLLGLGLLGLVGYVGLKRRAKSKSA